jgi:hypothetical protein
MFQKTTVTKFDVLTEVNFLYVVHFKTLSVAGACDKV